MEDIEIHNLVISEIDDKELLRSRINQQSELICILKKRADEYMLKCNEKEEKFVELNKEYEKLTNLYKEEQRRSGGLENSFFNLGKTHQDLIAVKDDVNTELEKLKTDYEILQQEKSRVADEVHNKDENINELEQCIISKEKEIKNLKENEIERIEQLNARHASNESSFAGIKKDFEDEVSKLKGELEVGTSLLSEANSKLQFLEKQEKEMADQLSTVMSMYTNEKKRCMELEERSHRKVDKVLAKENEMLHRTIVDLEEKHSTVLNNFNAYKGYTEELLNKEKSLNNKLRKLRSPECFTRSDSALGSNGEF